MHHNTTTQHSATATTTRSTPTRGIILFIGDILRLCLATVIPVLGYAVAQHIAAYTCPNLVTEITGVYCIVCAGGVFLACTGPLRRPIQRIIHWAWSEDLKWQDYGKGSWRP